MKVDMFGLGVLVYFVLSKGTHPFGNRFKRNGNIVDGVFELDKVKHLPDAYHLIASMVRVQTIRHARTHSVGNYQSCMPSDQLRPGEASDRAASPLPPFLLEPGPQD